MSEISVSAIGGEAAADVAAAFIKFGQVAAVNAAEVASALQQVFRAIKEYEMEKPKLWEVATPRQWYLYINGSPRASKKWHNALRRKARIAEKRRNR